MRYELLDYKKLSAENAIVEAVQALVDKKTSFKVTNVPTFKQGKIVSIVEDVVEGRGMRCRVYTNGRSLTGAIPFAVVHNLCTMFPDFEICKDFFGSGITVTHKDDKGLLGKI